MKKIVVFVMMLLSVAAYAQRRTVTGTVTEGSGYPAIGITVVEQGTQNGAVTDADGRYSITVAGPQAVLVFDALATAPSPRPWVPAPSWT